MILRLLILALLIIILPFAYYRNNKKNKFSEKTEIKHEVDEEKFMKLSDMVKENGYPFEIHHVTTPDGYILEIHRIPHGIESNTNIRKVVFLQHGVVSTSGCFIILGPKSALAYILADAGYDVWLGNTRGNTYSRNHTSLDAGDSSSNYWDFSWHEMGYYDVPTMIDYVLETTKQEKLTYIGHSEGTTVFYVMTSMRPEYNNKIIVAFVLSSVSYMSHIKSGLLKVLASQEKNVNNFLKILNKKAILTHEATILELFANTCESSDGMDELCTNIIFLITGFNRKEVNGSLIPVLIGHSATETAVKQLTHFAQLINSGRFCQYDYELRNAEKYGSIFPPDYNISAITTPIYIFYSYNDYMSDELDVHRFHDELPNSTLLRVEDTNYSHLDYVFGIHAAAYIYKNIVNIMKFL